MCGIFGWIKSNSQFTNDDILSAQNAVNTLEHRGPDSFGEWHNNNIFLGHKRLKIIDMSSTADQPFFDKEKNIMLV